MTEVYKDLCRITYMEKNQKQVWNNIASEWHKFKTQPSEKVLEFLKGKKGKILDFGSGSGRHLIKNSRIEFYLVDFSEEMIKLVGIPRPREILKGYPHELSGGMRQRVMIAMALSCKPGLLIADEPTTALDVTIQAQILELIKGLQESIGMAVLFITHDLGVIAEVSDRVAVMYAGKIQESGTSEEIFIEHIHPYTEGLLKSIPMLNVRKKKLDVIEGSVPDPINFPPGCKFNPRCKYKIDKCEKEDPELIEIKPGHLVRCWVKA